MIKFLDKIIERGILLLVFLIPWQARWIISIGKINGGEWEYGTQSLYATEILLAGILVLLVVGAYINTPVRGRFNFKRLLSPSGALLLFLIYAGLSVFWAVDKNTALIHWRWLVETGAVFALIASVETQNFASLRKTRNKIQWVIILSAVIQAVWGIIQFLIQSIPASTILGMAQQGADVLGASVIETLDGRWLRAYGSFPHPNMLGGWLVLGIIVVSRQWIVGSRKKIHEVFLLISFIIILFGLLMTFSRSAWLALGATTAYCLLATIQQKAYQIKIIKLIMVGILTTIVAVTIFSQPFLTRLNNASRLEYKSTSEREASLAEGWGIIKKHPLLGVGVGNYGLAVHRDIDSTKPSYYYQPAHNVFLLIWAELGLAGLFAILLVVLLLLSSASSGLLRGVYALEGARNDIIFVLPVIVIAMLDHYLWSMYSGLLIGAVYLANISRK